MLRDGHGAAGQQLPAEDYSLEDFERVWSSMLAILDKRGEHLLISHLGKKVPPIKGHVISIEVGTNIADIEIRTQQDRLLNYIRKQLKDYHVTMEITLNKEAASATIPYTLEEKYNALKEANPFLETFVRELGLQF